MLGPLFIDMYENVHVFPSLQHLLYSAEAFGTKCSDVKRHLLEQTCVSSTKGSNTIRFIEHKYTSLIEFCSYAMCIRIYRNK